MIPLVIPLMLQAAEVDPAALSARRDGDAALTALRQQLRAELRVQPAPALPPRAPGDSKPLAMENAVAGNPAPPSPPAARER